MTDMGWFDDDWYEAQEIPAYLQGDSHDRCEADIANDKVCLTPLDSKGNCPKEKHHVRS